MPFEVASFTPERMSVTLVDDPDISITAQFNPTQLQQQLSVNWQRQEVLGLSHQRLQYRSTGNDVFNPELYFRALGPEDLNNIERSRRFIMATARPRAGAASVSGGAPPRLLFVWPNLLSLTCVLTGYRFQYRTFNQFGSATVFTAQVTLEEIRDTRLTFEDVFRDGLQRSGIAIDGQDGSGG